MSSAQLLFEIGSFDISQPGHCQSGPNLLGTTFRWSNQHNTLPPCHDLRKSRRTDNTHPTYLCFAFTSIQFPRSPSPHAHRYSLLPPILLVVATHETMNTPILARRTASSVCLSCRRSMLRHFSSAQRLAFPEFQSYRLNTQPPSPPRSAAGPDTSITHPITPHLPRVHETRPPSSLDTGSWTSVREEEAQRSQPDFARPQSSAPAPPRPDPTSQDEPAKSATTAPAPSAEPSAPKPRPRSKLRAPRKAALKLTPAAVDHLRALLDQPDPKLIKVGVRNRGCSGLAYHLEYIDKPGAFDETVEQDGVKVLIDSKALFSIIGSEMDWVEDKLNQRFVFRNPNISE